MHIVPGHPLDLSNRSPRETNTYEMLDSLHIDYWTCDHPAAYTMEDCQAVDRILGVRMCKNLLLCNRQNTDFYLLLMPDDKPFRTKQLSRQLGSSRLSFADAAYMEKYLGISPGALSILGLMNDCENHVKLLVDEDLLHDEYIGCHPCVNTSSVRLLTRDAFGIFLQAVHHTLTPVHLTPEITAE